MSKAAFKKALVPVNDSDLSDRVILKASELVTKGFVEKIVLLTVWEANEIDYTKRHSLDRMEQLKQKAQNVLDLHKTKLNAGSIEAELIRAGGEPAELIIRTVQEGDFDLIIMGSRKLSKVQKFLLSTVSDRVTRLVDVPILIVK